MLQNWVRPLNLKQYNAFRTNPNNLGSKTSFFLEESAFSTTQIAILGVDPAASVLIREQLYSFQSIENPLSLYDCFLPELNAYRPLRLEGMTEEKHRINYYAQL